ncbi:MAG: hypothetical protein NC393_14900, partial [Clostridium sp.]|nr:hypothetical protein [Clostridium sp.]
SGLASLFLMAIFLNSLFDTQGKIAMDGNFSHIAPWRALYDDPFGINNLLRLFRKIAVKNTKSQSTLIPLLRLLSHYPLKITVNYLLRSLKTRLIS